jgi:organic hydroperoxide reductase OsmC/OhrA
MSNYSATVWWSRNGAVFADGRYSRAHAWQFDGGLEVPASASPNVVPLPYSDPAAIDPEEAFVASLSSCHMLWFLSLAAAKGFVVDSYKDEPVGILEKDAEGKLAMTRVTLRPTAIFNGPKIPTKDDLNDLHHEAHEKCFIASSVKTDVRCEPIVG